MKNKKKYEEEGGEEEKNVVKNKIKIITYLSIITLKIKGLNFLIKRNRKAGWIRKEDLYLLSITDPPQNKRHISSKSKSMEKDISCK